MMVNFINELWEQSMSKTIQAEQDLKNAVDKLRQDNEEEYLVYDEDSEDFFKDRELDKWNLI